jgi:flavin reductase (DIM6/NTAB) family NADH-FMN oxidoreductase RutF
MGAQQPSSSAQEGNRPMAKRLITPVPTLYPVPVVLVTAGIEQPDVITVHRIASCSVQPVRLCISIRPARHCHDLIRQTGEFVVNIPTPAQQTLADYLGVVSGRDEDKIATAGLNLAPATQVRTPILVDCPVNIECRVDQEVNLDSHTMFIGRVLAIHVDEEYLDAQNEVDLSLAQGIAYPAATVREKPTYKFQVEDLRAAVQNARRNA